MVIAGQHTDVHITPHSCLVHVQGRLNRESLPSIVSLLPHLTPGTAFSLLELTLSLAETKPAPLALPNYCISALISEK